MTTAKVLVSLAALLAGALLSAPWAHAEATSAEKAAAEALFDQGVALLRAHDYRGAATKLEASQRIEPAIGTLLYLGECYERLGRTASAWAMFREAGSMARRAGDIDRAKLAGERAARLEPELAYL
jgi:serine/threonine-protein kinase